MRKPRPRHICIGVSLLLFSFLFTKLFIGEWVYVASGSMFPTFTQEDKIWNNKCAYGILLPRHILDIPIVNFLYAIPAVRRFDKGMDWGYHRVTKGQVPKRMDIIIFKWNPLSIDMFVKRIIGLPGDTVQIKSGIVHINGKELQEEGKRIPSWDNYGPIVVADNHYFVLGDCRSNSTDSRTNGLVSFQNIIGKVSGQ